MTDTPNPRAELEELGYDVVYKPHETMARSSERAHSSSPEP